MKEIFKTVKEKLVSKYLENETLKKNLSFSFNSFMVSEKSARSLSKKYSAKLIPVKS